jgi:predicted ATP-grasp superfamily ATP-dependent carboligase
MLYKIDIDNNNRIFIVLRRDQRDGSALKVFQCRKKNGQWVWDGMEKMNAIDTEEMLIAHRKICPECKSDTDERGRCLTQCSKREYAF